MRDLLAELLQAFERGRSLVFCCVVETRGSTPQKAGAAMLVFEDGTQTGTLGGGCVEAEVKRKALLVLNDPAAHPEIASFCLDDDYGWDDGLICGGRMTMLIDPLRSGSTKWSSKVAAYYRTYSELIEAGKGCTEAIATPPSSLAVGSRFLFDAGSNVVAELAEEPPPAEIREHLAPLAKRPRPSLQRGIAYLPSLPRIALLIVGAGHVGQAVAELASRVDFEIWAVDDRDKFASRERFPTARKLIVGDIGHELKKLVAHGIHPGVYALIVTRGHNHDEEALFHLARTDAGYVGMIGSKRKIRLIFDDLIVKGISEEMLAKVHAPLGLRIGSQTVPEIAISIVAELIQHRNAGVGEK